jgi:protocatechuate 3,4-dioxygenase beta subunit
MIGRKLSSNGTLIAALLAVALIGGCDRVTTAPSSTQGNFFAAHLVVQNGNNQNGPSNAPLPLPVSVRVTDAGGIAVAGAAVSFAVRQGGGTVSSTYSVSDSTGIATSVWTLGASLGAQQLVALLGHGADSAVFTAVATVGAPAQILLISGNGQVGRSDQVLANPLVVQVTDAAGKPLPGASVVFAQGVANPDGFTSANPATTGPDGTASVTWTLGKNAGNTTVPMSVIASLALAPSALVTFTATARPEYRIRRDLTPFLQFDTTGATIGSPYSYLAGMRDTLRVQVYDPTDSSGVQGVAVTWAPLTSADSDGRTVNATTVTDNKGFAKTLWVLLGGAGGALQPSTHAKRMIATASMGQVEFQARVTPGAICSVTQATPPGPTLVSASISVSATVKDCNGFPVPGASVTFIPDSGSVSPSTPQLSNASGQAFATWTLGGTAGVQNLTARASGQADPYLGASYPTYSAASVLSVSATNLPPASVTDTNPPHSPSAAGSAFHTTWHVTDANGKAVVGQLVTFAVTAGVGTVAPGSGLTNGSGDITVLWTLGPGAATVNTLTATAGGVTGSVSVLTSP